ncbi:hypothetical protein NKDENANG_00083 [Candidatus Entotheonellaceae bacterium PAL068K]
MQLQTGRNLGMQLLDQALVEALQNQEIDPDGAFLYAQDKRRFQEFVADAGILMKPSVVGG